jgi:hypothetical protein
MVWFPAPANEGLNSPVLLLTPGPDQVPPAVAAVKVMAGSVEH